MAHPRRRRSIREDMAEMTAAAAAMNLGARKEEHIVSCGPHGVFERLPEARPAGAAVIFVLGRIEGELAAGANEKPDAVLVEEWAPLAEKSVGVGRFRPVLTKDCELGRRQDGAPLGLRVRHLEHAVARGLGD